MRLIDYFDRGVSRCPDRVCLTDERRSLTFRETATLTHRIANGLIANGITPATAAAVLSHNDIDAFACILGILRAGGAWMPINARNSLDDNVFILDHNECAWLFYHSAFAAEIEVIRAQAPKIRGFVCVDRPNAGDPWLADWVGGHGEVAPYVPLGPHDLASIWPSGGTTGRSKGVMLTNLNLTTIIENFASRKPYDAPGVPLVP